MAASAISAASSVVPSPTAADTAGKKLTSNFDTFLTLLTAQLRSQDPLSPMDSNAFTQQLVQFSQVEQQITSNKNLESLLSLVKSQTAGSAVSYLGKTLTLNDGTAALDNGEAKWTYTLSRTAASNRLAIEDSRGRTVYFASGDTAGGAHEFSWNGRASDGTVLPAGTYTLKVAAKSADGTAIGGSVSSRGAITEVDLSTPEPQLMIGPLAVPLSKATLISGN